MPVFSADTLQVKHFVEIALSHSDYEINAFLRFTQMFKMADQKWRESYFGGKSLVDSADTLWVKKNCQNCSMLHRL